MSQSPNPDLSGLEPTLGHSSDGGLTGHEPALGGNRRIDPRILDELRAGKWVSIERLRNGRERFSPTERKTYARALVAHLKTIDPNLYRPPRRDPRGPILLVLGVLGDPVALPMLIDALRDENFTVKRSAIQGLGHLGDPSGISPLLGLLDQSRQDRTSVSPFLVVDALGRLGATDPNRVTPRLLDLLDSDVWPDLKLCTLTALGRVGDPRAVEPLIQILHTHSDFRHRREAARALARTDHESVLPTLVLALSDRYRDVRYAVALALGHLDDSRAIQPLQMAYLHERVTRVRVGIERALARLGARPPGPDNPAPLPWFGSLLYPDGPPLET